jgi:hypothetical protein
MCMAATPELWNTDRVRQELGAKTIRSASRIILRLGLKPVAREPGRSGMNLYVASEVAAAIAAMPSRRRRTEDV